MYDEKMKAKHEAIRRIIDEMDNMMMGKMMPKEDESSDYEEDMQESETPVKIKMMKIEAEPEDDYSMDSEEGEPIDMRPIKELRKKLRGK